MADKPRPKLIENWRELLLTKMSKRGDSIVLPVAPNVELILRYHEDWTGVVAYDAFVETIVKLKKPPWHPADAPVRESLGEWSEADSSRAANWIGRVESLMVSPRLVDEALAVVADSNEVHPVREYLRSLTWDAKPRLDAMLPLYFGADDNAYTCGVGARWMISAVARIMKPGCQVDCTMVLEGKQGLGKTSALRAMVPDPGWYVDTGINVGDKDSYQNLRGVWIYGLDELDSLRRGDVTKWKNFLSQTRDRYRPSYGRRARDFARQNVFAGTTNEDAYLADRTGNRRYWPVRLRRPVHVAELAAARDQLWGEAVARFDAGERWHVDTPEFRALCEEQQAERVQGDPWNEIVAKWIENPTEASGDGRCEPFDISQGVLTSEVLVHALGVDPAHIKRADEMRVAEVLRTLDFVRGKRETVNGVRGHRYRKQVGQVAMPGVSTRDNEKTAPNTRSDISDIPDRAYTHENGRSREL
jgi:putative DNA primase/helicase